MNYLKENDNFVRSNGSDVAADDNINNNKE